MNCLLLLVWRTLLNPGVMVWNLPYTVLTIRPVGIKHLSSFSIRRSLSSVFTKHLYYSRFNILRSQTLWTTTFPKNWNPNILAPKQDITPSEHVSFRRTFPLDSVYFLSPLFDGKVMQTYIKEQFLFDVCISVPVCGWLCVCKEAKIVS